MKKLLTACLLLAAVVAVQAQSDFPLQFAYEDGTIVPDGTVLNLTETAVDGFGDVQVPTHLFVKNVSEQEVHGGGIYVIKQLSNGTFETCFPLNCVRQTSAGSYETVDDSFAAGALKNMKTEWYPTAEGTAQVEYQLLTFKKNPITQKWIQDQEGPKVTLNFAYSSSTGVKSVERRTLSDEHCYDLQGHRLSQSAKGLVIRKAASAEGTVHIQKQIVR